MYIIDAHCDAPTMMYRGRDFGKDNPGVQVDFPKMQRGGITASFFALYIPASLNEADAADYALVLLDSLKRQVEANESRVAFAFDENSLRHNASNGLVSVFIGLECWSASIKKVYDMSRSVTAPTTGFAIHAPEPEPGEVSAPGERKWSGR